MALDELQGDAPGVAEHDQPGSILGFRVRDERRPGGEETWISPEMRIAYGRLHELGLAHSFEVWPADALGGGRPVGGLYGVALGGAFFGESMFHTVTDAGKIALVRSVEHLRARGFALYDVQWLTPNLARYGAYELPGKEYRRRLREAIRKRCRF